MNPNKMLDDLEADNGAALYRCRHDAEHRQSVVGLLTQFLGSPDSAVVHRAMIAAGRIRGAFDQTNALAELVALVAKHLSSDDELIRRAAVGSLHCIGSHDADGFVPALIAACRDERLLDAALLALVDVSSGTDDAVDCFYRLTNQRLSSLPRCTLTTPRVDTIFRSVTRTTSLWFTSGCYHLNFVGVTSIEKGFALP